MHCPTYSITSFITPFINFVIQPIHLILSTAFLTFTFYINIVIVVIGSTIDAITAITIISKDRFVIDLRKRKLYFIIYKRLKGLKDCNIIRCLISVRQVKIQLNINFLNPSKQNDLYELVYNI